MDRKILIGGGIAAVFLIGVVVYRAKNKKVAQESADVSVSSFPSTTSVTGGFSGLAPISGGSTSYDTSSPSVAANSGSTNTGGGFDISSFLGTFLAGNQANAAASIKAGQATSDSAILAAVLQNNSGVSVTHSDTGTTVTKNQSPDPIDQIITNGYQTILGRAPDAGGAAWYKSVFQKYDNYGPGLFYQSLKESDEYKQLHANDPKPATK